VFANLPAFADPTCAAIAHPGSSPDCTEPFTPPIIGDLDGDGSPSCDNNCLTDPDDIARLCGTTLPFPPCDPSNPVIVPRDADRPAYQTLAPTPPAGPFPNPTSLSEPM
jgi:hypothetical protein